MIHKTTEAKGAACSAAPVAAPVEEPNEVKLNRALQNLDTVERELDSLYSKITCTDQDVPLESCKTTMLSLSEILNNGDVLINNHIERTIDKIQLIRRTICNA